MTQKIIRTGNSAAVTIPAEFARALSLRIGDQVEAEMDYKKGAVTYKFPNSRQLPLKGTKRRKGTKGTEGAKEKRNKK